MPRNTTMSSDEAVSAARYPGYRKPNILFFLTFMAFIVFRYVDGGHRMDILATIRMEFLLGGTAIVMSLVKISAQPLRLGRSRPIIWCILLLFGAMIVQLPLAGDPEVARRIFNDRVFKFALTGYLIAAMVESPNTVRWFLAGYLFAIFYVTLEATQGLINGSLMWENQGIMRLHGAVPMYGHPNSLGGVAMGALPYVIFLFGPFRRKLFRLGLLAVGATSTACVIYSGSRTAYLGLLSLFLWWFFQSRRKGRFVLVAVTVGAVALQLLPQQYIKRFESIGGEEAEGHSKDTRLEIMRDAVTILGEHPLGIGVASFPAVRNQRFGRSQDTHNLYLEVATNLGVQGLVVFLCLIGALLMSFRHSAFAFRNQQRRLAKAARRRTLPPALLARIRGHDHDLSLCLSTAQATAGFIIVRLVLGLFGMDLYEIYWWFASGLAIALAGLVVAMNRRTQFFELYASQQAAEPVTANC